MTEAIENNDDGSIKSPSSGVDKCELRRARDDSIRFCDAIGIIVVHPIDCAQFLSTVDEVRRPNNNAFTRLWAPVVNISISLDSRWLGSSGSDLRQVQAGKICTRFHPHQAFDRAPGTSAKPCTRSGKREVREWRDSEEDGRNPHVVFPDRDVPAIREETKSVEVQPEATGMSPGTQGRNVCLCALFLPDS